MKTIFVFPCGSEIGLEIHRSMKYSRHFDLIGGSSVDDHGRFAFSQYLGGIPFYNDPSFVQVMADIIVHHEIDAVYPAMDMVAVTLKKNEEKIGCEVIGSSSKTTSICASKTATYMNLSGHIPMVEWHGSIDQVSIYPIFIKPDVGYGSRNVFLAHNQDAARMFVEAFPSSSRFIYCEYLPGSEYTIDCFSNRHGELLFAGARLRERISHGISTHTVMAREHIEDFQKYAAIINQRLSLRGAWFFQMKLDRAGKPKLLEVAARLGGSSSLYRSQGINFALLSAFDAFDIDLSILRNNYETELDRALTNKYQLNIEYDTIYVDYDDCLVIDSRLNLDLLHFLFSALSKNKKIILITKHDGNVLKSLRKYRLDSFFDEVIHLKDKTDKKYKYIKPEGAIFIDDSYTERLEVVKMYHIPVFSPDMIESLL